jgi:hypothetical protein
MSLKQPIYNWYFLFTEPEVQNNYDSYIKYWMEFEVEFLLIDTPASNFHFPLGKCHFISHTYWWYIFAYNPNLDYRKRIFAKNW